MNTNQTTTVPNVEKVRMHDASFVAYADMTLAMIPVTVSGQYNVHSNCFYPSTVTLRMDLPDEEILRGDSFSLEATCEMFGWDYDETYEILQNTVEKRDQ